MTRRDEPPPELPRLPGGWELRALDFAGGAPVELWVPKHPDRLLDDVEVQERNAFNDAMPYWAWLWDSAPTMAERLLAEGEPQGTRVLELGAGLGLVGIALARAGGSAVQLELSDHDPLAQRALRVNADRNGLQDASVTGLDWLDLEAEPERQFELVVGCDVLYEARLHDPILDVLERFLAPGGTARFADPGRTRLRGFLPRAQRRGFETWVVDEAGDHAEPEVGAFRIVGLTRR